MNFGLFLFFQFFLHSSNVEIYKSIKTCVFNHLQRFPVSSVLKCAPKCYLMNCNGFQFNGNYCYFYGDGGTCQSDTPCPKVSIFVNDKVRTFQLSRLFDLFLFQLPKENTGFKFQLFNGIKSIPDKSLNPYRIINKTLIKMFIQERGTSNSVYVLGRNKDQSDSYLLDWPQSDLLNLLNKGKKIDETLVNRIMSVLTSGKCTNHSVCYRPFEKYESFVNDTNLVFGVTKNEKFDFGNVNRLILQNNWHFIVALEFTGKKFVQDLVNLMGIYGINRYGEIVKSYNFGGENLCKDL